MTHVELVARGARWLAAQGHSLVITEMATIGETPDAIGWRGSLTTLIECKASRRDWRNDATKPFRPRPEGVPHSLLGMGARRYLMCEADVIPEDEVYPGWGLLVVDARQRVRRVLESKIFKESLRNWRAEMLLLHSACRRLGVSEVPGVSVRKYTHSTQNKATCSIDPEVDDQQLLEVDREQITAETGGGAAAAGGYSSEAAIHAGGGDAASDSSGTPVAAG